jgi:autotransporter-associated beta strand protein
MKTKSPLFRIDRLLLAALVMLAAPAAQAQLYTGTNSTGLWNTSRWSTATNGPFSSAWTANSASLFKAGTGTYTFTGANSSGAVNVGNITLEDNVAVNFSGPSGTLSGGGVVRTISAGSGSTLDFGTQAFGSGGQGWIKTGNGVLALAGGAFTNGFTLDGGVVVMRGVDAMGAGSGNILTLSNGTVAANQNRALTTAKYGGGIRIYGNITFGALTNVTTLSSATANISFANNVDLGGSTRTLTIGGNGTYTFSGEMSNGGLTVAGSAGVTGNLTLSGANTYTGKTTLNSGTLVLSGSGTAGATNSDLDVTGGLLNLSGGAKTNAAFTLSGGTITNGTLQATSYALQGGTIISNATLGTGTATVTTGTTTLNGLLNAATLNVNSGTLTAGSSGRFTGTPTVTLSNGATLNLAGNETFGSLAGAGSVSNSAGRITAGGNNSSTTFGGVLSGAGELTKTGTGTLTLSGDNTFGGVLTVAEGKLTVSSVNNASQDGVLGNSANAVVLGASGQTGFLHYVGNTNASTDKTFTAATGGTAGIEASNAATTLTLSGVIGGAGNVQKGGAGTLLLAGNNTFTGALNVHDGTLEIASINNNSANGTLGNSTNPVSLGKSGTANVSTLLYTGGTASTTKGFSMASDATAGVINVANSGTTLTVSGPITGSSGSGLTKTGIGRLSLSGSSSYNGATTVSAGDLNLSGGSITNSAVTVASGASLSGYGSVGTIGGAGAINPGNSPGILTTPQVNPSGGTDFNFEMTGTAPTYNNAANSVNDLIQITGGTPFSQALAAGNGVFIYFSGAALFTGSTAVQYQGGFFTDQSASFASSISGATYNYYFANTNGPTTYNGVSYYNKAQYESLVLGTNMLITVTTVAQTANFGSGNVSGQVMQVQVIPEPSTYALLGLSAVAFGAYRWRRRHGG